MNKRWVAAACTALVVLACGGAHGPANGSFAGPCPIVLKDTAAGQLGLTVALNMGSYDASTRDRSTIDVIYQHAGHPVAFIAGEEVTCGGVALQRFVGSFEIAVPTASISGRELACLYTSGHQTAPFAFHVPKALVILSPRDHEQVAHGPNTMISYSGEPDSSLWVVALGSNVKAVARPDAIKATNATVDTSAIGAGPGSIAVTDPTCLPLQTQGALFQSVGGCARRMTMVAVVWT